MWTAVRDFQIISCNYRKTPEYDEKKIKFKTFLGTVVQLIPDTNLEHNETFHGIILGKYLVIEVF